MRPGLFIASPIPTVEQCLGRYRPATSRYLCMPSLGSDPYGILDLYPKCLRASRPQMWTDVHVGLIG